MAAIFELVWGKFNGRDRIHSVIGDSDSLIDIYVRIRDEDWDVVELYQLGGPTCRLKAGGVAWWDGGVPPGSKRRASENENKNETPNKTSNKKESNMGTPTIKGVPPTDQELREEVAEAVAKCSGSPEVTKAVILENTPVTLLSPTESDAVNETLKVVLSVVEEARQKITQLYERCEEILVSFGKADELQQENARLKEKLQRFATYTDWHAEPCPMCEYDADGKLAKVCCFHQEIAKLRAECAEAEKGQVVGELDIPSNEELRSRAAKAINTPFSPFVPYESALDAARKKIASLAKVRDAFADLCKGHVACVDEAFQGQNAILPDYCRVGDDKFGAVVHLARDFVALKKRATDLEQQLNASQRHEREYVAFVGTIASTLGCDVWGVENAGNKIVDALKEKMSEMKKRAEEAEAKVKQLEAELANKNGVYLTQEQIKQTVLECMKEGAMAATGALNDTGLLATDKHQPMPSDEEIDAVARQPLAGTPPTDADFANACLSYRHDFGLFSPEGKQAVLSEAKEWYEAFRKNGFINPPIRHRSREEWLTALQRVLDGGYYSHDAEIQGRIVDALRREVYGEPKTIATPQFICKVDDTEAAKDVWPKWYKWIGPPSKNNRQQ
jgi:tetrahydromethanopterin S-methyltransferase subunit G